MHSRGRRSRGSCRPVDAPLGATAPALAGRAGDGSAAFGTAVRPDASRDPGHGVLAAVRRRPLAAYLLLTYLLSWGYWVPVAVVGGHLSHFPGLLGPMVAAFMVRTAVAGRAGVADLLRRMGRWRAPVRWYAAALAPLAAAVVAIVVKAAFGGGTPSLDQLGRMPGLPAAGWFTVFALTFLVNGYGEETGWRGFAWPLLRVRHGLARAALLLTVPWALWHLPTFWLDTGLRGFAPVMVPGFLLGMAAGAVVLGWLFERAHGSVLVVALFHAALNMASATNGTEDVAPAASAVVIVWAVLILRAERRRTAGLAAPARTIRGLHLGSFRSSATRTNTSSTCTRSGIATTVASGASDPVVSVGSVVQPCGCRSSAAGTG